MTPACVLDLHAQSTRAADAGVMIRNRPRGCVLRSDALSSSGNQNQNLLMGLRPINKSPAMAARWLRGMKVNIAPVFLIGSASIGLVYGVHWSHKHGAAFIWSHVCITLHSLAGKSQDSVCYSFALSLNAVPPFNLEKTKSLPRGQEAAAETSEACLGIDRTN